MKRGINAKIPINEAMILSAINKGVPVVASRERNKSPMKELLEFSDQVSNLLTSDGDADSSFEEERSKSRKLGFGLRR